MKSPVVYLQKAGKVVLNPIELLFSKIFTDQNNPFFHLGALSFFFFWIAAGTGLYLYVFFETSVAHAYESIEYLMNEQWYLGGIMRSLHRYSSAAMVVAVTLHLLREFVKGRYQGVRIFSWVSGVPLLWLLFLSAIGGYWLVWDQLAQYIAILSSELLDWLPIMVDPMARNFLNAEAMSDRLFSLLAFLHIGFPLALLLGMFIHIQRISYAKTNPPKQLAIGVSVALVMLSLVNPAASQAPANLDETVANVGLDWFYLNVFPLIELWGPGWVWGLLVAISGLMTILPWLSSHKRKAIAVVDPANCNGCSWCFADCPYGAVTMKEHDFKKGHKQSVVNPDLCIGCGICAGACPSSTPFRSVDELITGIDMPELPVKEMLAQTDAKAKQLKGDKPKVIVYACECGAPTQSLQRDNVATISLPCVGQLPPSFVDYIFRNKLADGVMVTGCCEEDCHYRLGNTWLEQRFAAQRFPHLRTSGAKRDLSVIWAGEQGAKQLEKNLDDYIQTLEQSGHVDDKRFVEGGINE
ncbi:MAG: cytochrome b N-terminal domain-containing protein [Pseudomonadales bacterium]|nr:cytochrome b N-terminal domain-containing protein [Pseudomonadales bacterium]MCP5215672.1 cytochrome b N-terminal domain-containing protein [Pseudomonadales bacterium]